jgi:alkylhydroperoxidase/carboxymuconolactone decarboxylase family protein YurZ
MVDSSWPQAPPGERKWSFAWWLFPSVVAVVSYAAAWTVGFVWDDQSLIQGSPLITGQSSWLDHFFQPFWGSTFQSARSFYRPLMTLSYAADFRLWHGWPGGYHLTNLLLHLISAVLVGRLCLRAGARETTAGLLASAFAAFPRLTESVAWISGRTDVAAGMFTLAAILVSISGCQGWRKALAGFLLLLGLFCKEVALAGVVALALYEWHSSGLPRRPLRSVRNLIPILAAPIVYATLRSVVMFGRIAEQGPLQRTVANVALASTEAVARYAIMLADPLRPRLQIGSVEHLQPALSTLGILLVVAMLMALRRWAGQGTSMQWMAFGLGASAIAMVLHLVPFQVNIVAADRFLYLPVAALAVFVAPTGERLFQLHPRLVLTSGVFVVSLFAIATSVRVRTWSNDVALWREEVAHVGPSSALPYNELGIALIHRARYAEALAILDVVRGASSTVITRATCLDKLGRRAEAVALLRALAQQDPSRTLAPVNLMLMAARERHFEEARAIAEGLPAELKGRSDMQALRQQIEDAAAEWARFPPEAPDEAVALRAARATWFERLGAVPEATARWRSLVVDATVDESTCLRAAAYVVGQGTKEQARATLAALVQRGVAPTLIASFEATLAGRFEDD